MSRVSIIIPTLNRKALLPETLDSIFHQTHRPYEIVIVDDHSTDGTVEFLRTTYGAALKVVSNHGKGPGAARNTGLRYVAGEFIKFFDSDDVMTCNTLEVQLKALQASGKQFVTGPYFYAVKREGSWKSQDGIVLNHRPVKGPLWHHMMVDGLFITIPGMLFRRELLDRVGPWREDVTAYEDWDFLFRLSLLEPLPAHDARCAFVYRLHGQQTTESNFNNAQRDRDKILVIKSLLTNFVSTDDRFSVLEKTMLENMLYQVYRVSADQLKDPVSAYDSMLQRIVWEFRRLRNKLGRIRTESDWQPCHGPLRSHAQIETYLALLSK